MGFGSVWVTWVWVHYMARCSVCEGDSDRVGVPGQGHTLAVWPCRDGACAVQPHVRCVAFSA